jgi:hypothetical protein
MHPPRATIYASALGHMTALRCFYDALSLCRINNPNTPQTTAFQAV